MLGLSDFKSRLKLWHEKRGDIEPDDLSDNIFSKWGKRLQVQIGIGISQDEGWRSEDLTGFYLCDPESRLGASMDMKAYDDERGYGLLEIKRTTSLEEKYGWTDDRAPMDYEFQIATQMGLAVFDGQQISWGAIGVLDGASRTRIYHRKPDMKLFAILQEEARKFWQSIEQNEPPAPDYLADAEIIRKLQGPVRVGDIVDLSGNNRAHAVLNDYLTAKDRISEYGGIIEAYDEQMRKSKNHLHDLMGAAEFAVVGDYRITAREQMVEESLRPGYSFRRFDVKTMKGKRK